MKKRLYKKVKNAESNSNNIMRNGVLIGCHHGLTKVEINHIFSTFLKFLKKNKLQN